MHIVGGDENIRNEVVLHIYGAVVQVKESFWLAFSKHIATVRICGTNLHFFVFVHLLPRF